MNITEHRKNYFHLDGPKVDCAKRLESEQMKVAVEAFKAKGGKIERIPQGYSTYLNNLDNLNKERFGRKQ